MKYVLIYYFVVLLFCDMQDLPFDDGTGPPPEIIEQFFELLRTRFNIDPGCCVAVHCVAGLGR